MRKIRIDEDAFAELGRLADGGDEQQHLSGAGGPHGSLRVSAAAIAASTALALLDDSLYSYGPFESATTPPPACT